MIGKPLPGLGHCHCRPLILDAQRELLLIERLDPMIDIVQPVVEDLRQRVKEVHNTMLIEF